MQTQSVGVPSQTVQGNPDFGDTQAVAKGIQAVFNIGRAVAAGRRFFVHVHPGEDDLLDQGHILLHRIEEYVEERSDCFEVDGANTYHSSSLACCQSSLKFWGSDRAACQNNRSLLSRSFSLKLPRLRREV